MRVSITERIGLCLDAIRSLEAIRNRIDEAARHIVDCLDADGRLFACGNGGSAAEAMHFATECSGRYRSNRVPLPALALCGDGTAMTCVGNDFGWCEVFARQLQAHARKGDLLLAISTSGNSANVLEAIAMARKLGVHVIGLLGKGGGEAASGCDVAIVVDSSDTGAIQEAHLAVIHMLCEYLEPRCVSE